MRPRHREARRPASECRRATSDREPRSAGRAIAWQDDCRMDKWQVARALDEIAKYVDLSEPNRFKSLAFEKAARAISSLDRDPADLIATGDLQKTPGIGKTTASVVEEIVRTGSSRYLDELRQKYPAGIFELLRVPKLGLKKIGMLHEKLGIGSLDELEEACRSGKLRTLRGFGEKTEQQILKGIAFARKRESQFLLPLGIEIGEAIREQLAQHDAIENAEISGSVRRRLEVVRNVNIVVATRDVPTAKKIFTTIVADLEPVDETTFKGTARDHVAVIFHIAKPSDFGSTLFRTTGSREFVDAFGDIKPAKSEEQVFEIGRASCR